MSSQKEIELILARQLASHLAMPIFIVDPPGNLIYYNEPAEAILGRRFEETGEMSVEEWSTIFKPTDENGNSLAPELLPLVIALRNHRPAHRGMWIVGLDGVRRQIEVTAFPLDGQAERYLGALAIFWEPEI
ncbi:MAG: PAS domain-containing protein [Anaerolineae bacterium]|nr:PAS domain-containing protein [Anaerolineae bacterium]MCI0610795.1 PAS domain-containing protein [Anaerolineae bacterium]